MNEKFTFVILHYYTIDDTINCVKSIKKIGNEKNINIVIVDNASKNDTGAKLKEIYESDSQVNVLINKENLGFAKGNNIGFEFAKKQLEQDYIIMCNNDTYLIQDNFFELISEEYRVSDFAVLGPQILLPNEEINQVVKNIPSVTEVKKQLHHLRIDYITNFLYINELYLCLRKTIKNIFIKLKLKKVVKNNKELSVNERYENIVLHGCFLIFSKKYIDIFDGIDDRTFLYREEELLAQSLKINNLKSVYNPNIKIFHNEDSSTNAITKNKRSKKLFTDKYQIESTKILLNDLIDFEKKRGKM